MGSRGGTEQPLPVSPVVVHDLVVQVLLVGQVPVGGQVLLVCLLMEVAQLGCRGHGERGVRLLRGDPLAASTPRVSPSPGKGHRPHGHPPALTLQQVGDEQRRALVAAGQPPRCQVLLDLEGEEVPVEGDRSVPWGSRAQQRAGCRAEPRGLCCGGLSAPRLSLHSPVFQPKGCRSARSRGEHAAPAEGCS